MVTLLLTLMAIATSTLSSIIPRAGADPGFQIIPTTAKDPNTFNFSTATNKGMPPVTDQIPPALYGARSIDLPFGRLFHGNMKFFRAGELNTPDGITDEGPPGQNDNANQSACGIPDNAWSPGKVAIHPYFLKYAGLDRYCMQDVCVSFWREDGGSDMMAKVTDICSTDPDDPSHCASPEDIKLVRTKVQVMEKLTGEALTAQPSLMGDELPEQAWWYFAKCWGDGTAVPAYTGAANNWFTTPPYPNNNDWALKTDTAQYENNQNSYKAKGWPTYLNGFYTKDFEGHYTPLTDWIPGQEPAWQPIAGGKGFGIPKGNGSAVGNDSQSSQAESGPSQASNGTYAMPSA
ncbi:hypothetical protein MMC28_001313 [Mycoblastus sanguinarius]|nr:hypothetical protein [Mycoblastus sanguinarius]